MIILKSALPRIIGITILLLISINLWSQTNKAVIKEEKRSILTYPFGDPTRTPLLTENPKIYPYFTFEGYSHEGEPREWKVIKLENDYVEVYVLPEAGGKVWGAIDKSTGKEFIYRNEVMKFRNIAMRGPWTSGGIEFNFGLIGHTPVTATPVDYLVRENADGSVSCIVGNIDLPSRTQWRVEIRLPHDKTYFETRALWYNPSPLHQSYYNWMTGAAAARDDLEFFCPGDQYLAHSGEAHPWPVEYGRKISEYRQNNFGGSKSYHVVGEYNDFFGGYFHDDDAGFGHWARYDEMPGQKLWLWALSRSGGIWEDLLTDTDGQYIEFQAGRLFNQYSPSSHHNPITQAVFQPYTTDRWQELWFPVNEIGGMTDVSPAAAMHVREENGKISIAINALAAVEGTLQVIAEGEVRHHQDLAMQPAEIFKTEVDKGKWEAFEVVVPEMALHFYSDPQKREIDRPFQSPVVPRQSQLEQWYREGRELMEYRAYEKAMAQFQHCLTQAPAHLNALTGAAELYFRQGLYDQGIDFAKRALQFDTYDAGANYIAGNIYRAQHDYINALEALGWAARSMEYRSAAYAQMAEIHLLLGNWQEARHYATSALDFNRYNINAYQTLAIAARKTNDREESENILSQLLGIDPLHHFARVEKFLWNRSDASRKELSNLIRSELPYQTYLELGIDYYNKGLEEEALAVLDLAPSTPLVNLWRCYLQRKDPDAGWQNILEEALEQSPDFVFPYRRETIDVLEWALKQEPHWKSQYFLALNYWAKDRKKEAAALMEAAAAEPDYAPFYFARAELLLQLLQRDPEADLHQALEIDPEEWRFHHRLIRYYSNNGSHQKALELARTAREKFPDKYNIGMEYAEALLSTGNYAAAIETLQALELLPFEGASRGRRLYERAHLAHALQKIHAGKYSEAISTLKAAKEWPENLGVGKPYNPEERPQDFLLHYCHRKLQHSEAAADYRQSVVAYTHENFDKKSLYHYLGLKLMPDSEAEALIQKWRDEKLDESVPIKWVIAKYRNDEKTLARLEMAPGNKALFHGMEVELLREVIDL